MFFKKKRNSAPTKRIIAKTKRRFADAIISSRIVDAMGLSDVDEGKVVEGEHGLKFYNKTSKFSKRVTLGVYFLIVMFFLVAFVFNNGTYLAAWVFSSMCSVLLLTILSFPRSLVLTSDELVINCVLETRIIKLTDVKRIHPINTYRMKRTIPLFGSYGFGGFFGTYVDLIHWRQIRLYASNLQNIVYVQTVYNDHYIISCENSGLLIERAREEMLRSKPEYTAGCDNWAEQDGDDDDD